MLHACGAREFRFHHHRDPRRRAGPGRRADRAYRVVGGGHAHAWREPADQLRRAGRRAAPGAAAAHRSKLGVGLPVAGVRDAGLPAGDDRAVGSRGGSRHGAGSRGDELASRTGCEHRHRRDRDCVLAMTSHRGFTLIEALVAVVLLAIVGQSILRLLTVTQRLFRAQSERAALQATVRAGASLLPAELRELGPGDIISLAPDRLVYRAMRSAGAACVVTATDVRLRRDLLYGYRSIAPTRDSLLLFADHDPFTADDDAWEILPVGGPPGPGVCPDGGAAVVVPTIVPAAIVGAVTLDAPIRTFELVEERLYQS